MFIDLLSMECGNFSLVILKPAWVVTEGNGRGENLCRSQKKKKKSIKPYFSFKFLKYTGLEYIHHLLD